MILLDAPVSFQCPDTSGTLRANTSPDVQPKWIQDTHFFLGRETAIENTEFQGLISTAVPLTKGIRCLSLTHRVVRFSLALRYFRWGPLFFPSSDLPISKSSQTCHPRTDSHDAKGKPDPGFLTERLNHPRWAETTVHMKEVTPIKFF